MPTNNKTSLGLNNWIGTDKPKRSDFVEDNTTLNTLLTTHFGDTERHLSAADRALLIGNFDIGNYVGNGESTQVITLLFEPRIVLVFLKQAAMNDYIPKGSFNENNFAIVTKKGGSMGLKLSQNKLTVCQSLNTPSGGGVLVNLNCCSEEYIYIAFR